MSNHPQAATVGQLKATEYRPRSVKDELRANLIRKLKANDELFPGIVGYRDTVIPQIINAILSKHDILFLGLRGQAKTRKIGRASCRERAAPARLRRPHGHHIGT